MSADMSNFTKATHRAPYAAISPTRPELSHKGKIVLVTGSSDGIGFAIARNFAKAHAAKVILTGRRQAPLDDAVATLEKEFPQTIFSNRKIDVSDVDSVESVWKLFNENDQVVDVLVLNAGRIHKPGSMVQVGYKEVWADFATNVGSHMAFADFFYNQAKRDLSKKLLFVDPLAQAIVNISTFLIHSFDMAPQHPNYSASKSAGTMVLQQIAKGVSADDMQIVSFHPGAIFTSANKAAGFTETSMNWDDVNLPGQYAVWATSNEASFLHGRFAWAAWDVEELATGEKRSLIDKNPNLLKVGVVGL
ncbi:hypothetical protein V8C42DRAFT_355944 [Trichoderma barbatum]